jgi:predicted double-glycine peptidase
MIGSKLPRALLCIPFALSIFFESPRDRLEAGFPSGAGQGDKRDQTRHWREAESCGVACGYMLARLIGRRVEYDDAVSAIVIENGGTSLLALQQGLRKLGVAAISLKVKPKELDQIAMPVIAHMLPHHETTNAVGHYLLVLKVDDHFVQYIEPNYAASIETVPRNQFLRCWSGYLVAPTKTTAEKCVEFGLWCALATTISIAGFPVSRRMLNRVSAGLIRRFAFFFVAGLTGSLTLGCAQLSPSTHVVSEGLPQQSNIDGMSGLVAWNTEADLGPLPRNGFAEALFRIENQGDDEVRLRLGSPSCRCSQAWIEAESLKPGDSTIVHMRMQSRVHQAGPADARVYLEAEEKKWAEVLRVHALQLGANFPEYSYVLGGPQSLRSASVVGNLFLKEPAAAAELQVLLAGTGLERTVLVRKVQIGPPVEMPGCVRRECSFRIELVPGAQITERREIVIPIHVAIDGETETHRVRVNLLPTNKPTK